MYSLERVQVDKFKIEDAITLEELEVKKDNIDLILIKMEEVFSNVPRIDLNKDKEKLFLNGAKITLKDKPDGLYNVYIDNIYFGLGTIHNKILKRDIIIKKEE